ncbi:MAG: HIT domain-containing protein [Candidatus Absconditabacterales bacterium]|nr:HIT domain-containing protein [Candidatus Absconditabacterales bacterium]
MIISREEYEKIKGNKSMFGKDDCPFCTTDLSNVTLRKGKYRAIIINIGSYTGTSEHIMAIPKAHKILMTDLDTNEIMELPLVFQAVKHIMNEKEYFSFTRETVHNSGRSVEHLHIHYCPGQLQGEYLRHMLMKQGFPIVQHLN